MGALYLGRGEDDNYRRLEDGKIPGYLRKSKNHIINYLPKNTYIKSKSMYKYSYTV